MAKQKDPGGYMADVAGPPKPISRRNTAAGQTGGAGPQFPTQMFGPKPKKK